MEFLVIPRPMGTCWCIAWDIKGQMLCSIKQTYVSELCGDLCVLFLILLSRLPLVLIELCHSITAQVLELFRVVANLLRLLFNLVHEFAPGLKYLTSYVGWIYEREACWKMEIFGFDMEEMENWNVNIQVIKIINSSHLNALLGAIIITLSRRSEPEIIPEDEIVSKRRRSPLITILSG